MTAEQKAATAATSSTAAKPIPEQGTEWIICRVCGYIEDAKYRDQPCPTCGFSSNSLDGLQATSH